MYFDKFLKHITIVNRSLLLFLIIDLFGLFSISHSQTIKVINTTHNENKLVLNFISTAESFISKIDGKHHFDYDLSMDESTPGKPILPSQIFIVAIPPNAEVSAELRKRVDKVFDQAQLKI